MTPYDQVLGDGGKEEFPLIGKDLWQNQHQWGSALSVIGWRGEGKKENSGIVQWKSKLPLACVAC